MKALHLFALISVLCLFACKNDSPKQAPASNSTTTKTSKTIDYQGHRGARGLYPENTITGMIKALDYPIQTLEMDLVVSSDDILILSHEPWMSGIICSTAEGKDILEEEAKKLSIYQMTYKEIKTYDCGSRIHPRFKEQEKIKTFKPSFMDAISNIELHCQKTKRAAPFYNIELKSQPEWYGKYVPQPKDFVKMALEEIKTLGIESRVTLQSFDINILNEIHQQAPDITTSFLVENIEGLEANLAKINFTPDIYSPYFMLLNQENIQAIHDKGMKVIPWTINDPSVMDKLIAIGVDGIITDYPNLIQK